jgi:hypothetical protein
MKRLLKAVLFIGLCLLCLSACKTSHHATGNKHKKHKKNCNCPKFSYQETHFEHTYVFTTN